jgi:hypothetical protein
MNHIGRPSLFWQPKPTKPVAERVVVSNMKVAQLVNALRLTPNGLLVLHDDVGGWLMRGQQNGGNVGNLFNMWCGQPLSKSRLDRSPIVDRGFASITGRIDPAVMHRALNPRIPNDGKLHEFGPGFLLIRLLLAMPPSRSDTSAASATASPASESRLAEMFNYLWEMDSANHNLGCAKPIDLSPSDGARDEFAGFRAHDLGERNLVPSPVRPVVRLSPLRVAIRAHLSLLPSG